LRAEVSHWVLTLFIKESRCLLNSRYPPFGPFAPPLAPPPDEVLVTDARAYLTPADLVERKLLDLLNGCSLGGRLLRLAGPGDIGRRRG
jgi:hypothetical protein